MKTYDKNFIGQKFGKLTVVEFLPPNERNRNENKWLCKCDCGGSIQLGTSSLKTGNTKSCGCIKLPTGALSPQWKGFEEISKVWWLRFENNAKTREIEIDITIEQIWNLFLEQKRKCALTGWDIAFPKTWSKLEAGEGTASLDRIDCNQPYILPNVRWVHKDINVSKLNLQDSYFLELCSLVCNPNFESEAIEALKSSVTTNKFPLITKFKEPPTSLVGNSFGDLRVIKYVGSSKRSDFWLCECLCKNKCYHSTANLKAKHTKLSCRECRLGNNSTYWKGIGDLSKNFWNCIIHSANTREIEIKLTMSEAWECFVMQKRRCAITGLPLVFGKTYSSQNTRTASLDRIDSGKGYTVDNVRWVHRLVNKSKLYFDDDYYKILCKAVYDHNKEKIDNQNRGILINSIKMYGPSNIPVELQEYR